MTMSNNWSTLDARFYFLKCIITFITWHDENRFDFIQAKSRKTRVKSSFQICWNIPSLCTMAPFPNKVFHERIPKSVYSFRGSRVSSHHRYTVRSLLSFIWTRVRFFWIAWTSAQVSTTNDACNVQAGNLWLPRRQSGQTFEARIDLGGRRGRRRECARVMRSFYYPFFVHEFFHCQHSLKLSGTLQFRRR